MQDQMVTVKEVSPLLSKSLAEVVRNVADMQVNVSAAVTVLVSDEGDVSCSITSSIGVPSESVLLVVSEVLLKYVQNQSKPNEHISQKIDFLVEEIKELSDDYRIEYSKSLN